MHGLEINHEKLKQRATEERWSDAAIARKSGISQAGVSKVMGGRVEPKATTLKKICDTIGLPIEEAFIDQIAA